MKFLSYILISFVIFTPTGKIKLKNKKVKQDISYRIQKGLEVENEIKLTAGLYILKRPVEISNLHGVTIVGASAQLTILTASNMVAPFIFKNCSGITIKDLTIECDTTDAITIIGGGSDYRFINLEIKQDGIFGIHFSNTGNSWSNILLRDVQIEGNGRGIGFLPSSGPDRVTSRNLVMDNVIIKNFYNGCDTGGTLGKWEDVRIINCVFEDNLEHGVRFYHAGALQVTNCLFQRNKWGAWFDNGSEQHETLISNCKFVDNEEIGVITEEWRNVIFSNNIVVRNQYGLWLTGARSVIINGCIIENYVEGGSKLGSYEISHPGIFEDLIMSNNVLK